METETTKDIKVPETGQEIQTVRPERTLSPFDEMDRMFDRMLEGVFPRGWLHPLRMDWPAWGERSIPLRTRIPKVDVIDRDDEVVLRAEIPGIDKDDLEVTLTENTVTIKGEAKREQKEEKGDYYCCEISRGAFTRTMGLPHYINKDAAKARFADGVLELTLPKIEPAKRHKIKID